MSNDSDDLNLSEEDRLPWLEAVEDEEDGPNPLRVLGGVLVALMALGLIVGGIWWMQQRNGGGAGNGELIAAPEGDYKQPTSGNDGLKVGNDSDAMLATSQGNDVGGKVNTGPDAEKNLPSVQSTNTSAGQNTGVKAAPGGPGSEQTVASISGPGAVQLGAYASADKANQQWTSIAAKVPDLAKLPKSVEPVTAGGKTVYRLRVKAADAGQATALCGKVTAGGGNCIVVR